MPSGSIRRSHHGRLRAGLGGGDGLPAAAGLVGAAGAGDGRGLLDGGQGAGLLHALVVLDLLLSALLAAECHLTPARSRQQNPTIMSPTCFFTNIIFRVILYKYIITADLALDKKKCLTCGR